MLPTDGETWASLSAKVDPYSQVATDEWQAKVEAFHQASLTAAAAADEYAKANNEYRALPQYNLLLAAATDKPVCETITPEVPSSNNSEPVTSTSETPAPETSQPQNIEPDTTVSQASSSETPTDTPTDQTKDDCLNPPDIPTGTDYTFRRGEEMTVEIPLCPEWGESAGIVLGADGDVNSQVLTLFPSTTGTKTAVLRIAGQSLFTTSFWVYQIKQSFPYAESEKRYFSVTIVPAETVDPCADTTPDVSLNSDGILTGKSDCDAATHWEMILIDTETKETKAHWVINNSKEPSTRRDLGKFIGKRKYFIESSHLVIADDDSSKRRVGLTSWYELQLDILSTGSNEPQFDPLGTIDLPPVLYTEPDSESAPGSEPNSQTSDDDKPAVSPAFVVVEPRATSTTCDQTCTNNVVQQSGIAPEKVKAVEVSVDGSAWETLTPNLLLPLTSEATTIQLRVSPTDNARPVVLSTTLYKNAAAINDSTESQTLIVSGSGTQSVEVVAADDGSLPTTWIVLIAIAVIILLLLATLYMRARRKGVTA
jgi:hypothetical protein